MTAHLPCVYGKWASVRDNESLRCYDFPRSQVLASVDAKGRLKEGLPLLIDLFAAAAILESQGALFHNCVGSDSGMIMPAKHSIIRIFWSFTKLAKQTKRIT